MTFHPRSVSIHTKLAPVKYLVAMIVLCLLALLTAVPRVYAASSINVNTTTDENGSGADCSLREAIETANTDTDFGGCTGAAGGPFTINIPAGTYTLLTANAASADDALQIGPAGGIDVTLSGAGSGTTIITTDAATCTTGTVRVLNLDPNLNGDVDVQISGVTISNGIAKTYGGGAILGGGTGNSLTLSDSIITDNCATGVNSAAGISWSPDGDVTITDSTFSDNLSGQAAGALLFDSSGTLELSGSLFSGNTAGITGSAGGAIFLGSGTFNLNSNTFINNQATNAGGIGGAIYLGSGTLNLGTTAANVIVGNSAGITTSSGLGVRGGSATAENNWWGCNDGPDSGSGCDLADNDGGSLDSDPWVVLSISASPTSVNQGSDSTLTADFLHNSDGGTLTDTFVAALVGRTVTWSNAQLGSLSAEQTTIQAAGTATATFTGTSCGAGGADAAVDNSGALTASVTVTSCTSPADFVITVKTDNAGTSSTTEFTIPTTGGGYNYNVDCNDDGTNDALAQTGNYTCSYGVAGTYTIRIQDNSGAGTGFPRIYFNDGGDKLKLLTIEQWGTGKWTSMDNAFFGCANLAGQASDNPDLSGVTALSRMFRGATVFNQDISGWDTSNVTSMAAMFRDAAAFNRNIGSWDTANVTDMNGMFLGASAFNQNIGTWDTGSVTGMSFMFQNASAFNQPIGTWDVSNVTNMQAMLQNTAAFNQPLATWDTSGVTNMQGLFGSSAFNQPIGTWDTSNVTTMLAMFSTNGSFNQDIGSWDTSQVTNMSFMFNGATAFDQNLGGWNVTALTNAASMFTGNGLSTANYDALLIGWDAQTLQSTVTFDGGLSQYCNSQAARSNMINSDGWTITDGGKGCTVQTGPNFVVNAAADTDDGSCDLAPGNCTLREAINAANALAGADTITFNIPDTGADCSSNNVCTIALGSSLPNISDDVTIDGAPNSGAITVSGNDNVRILQLTNNKTLNLNALTVADGFASSSGAGLYVNGGATLNVSNSTFSGNSISTSILQSGGAAILNVAGTVRVTNSTFAGNSFNVPVNCGPCGGTAILNLSGTLEVTNSTFSGNTFTSAGTCNPSCGGAIRTNGGTTAVTNSTFSGNLVTGNGHAGAFSVESGTVTLRNSIISGSTPVDCFVGGGTLAVDSYNIDSDGSCGSATTYDTTAIALGALANNGGSTQTMALANNSVAIDTGHNDVCAAAVGSPNYGANGLDQRGEPRDDLNCDVGAFEFVLTDGNTIAKSNLSVGSLYTFGPTLAGITSDALYTGALTISRDLTPPGNTPPPNALPITWDATNTTAIPSLIPMLCYDPSVLTGQNESTLHVWHYNGSTWDDLGGTLDDTTRLPYHCITAQTALTSLSPLAIAPAATTAVNVAGPSGRVNSKGKIVVKWRTTNESQIAGFNIFRKNGKGEWKQINQNFKSAKHPGDAQGEKYRFTNRNVRAGKTYRYKIQVVYLDNHTEWTESIKVKTPKK